MTYAVDIDVARLAARTGPYFGRFGGRFVPEALVAALEELDAAYQSALTDPEFMGRLDELHRTYTGRPSLLTERRTSPGTPAGPGSSSSARTSITPAPTRSTTCWARPC